VGFVQEGCYENGNVDRDCCALPGTGGCLYGRVGARGGLCAADGAVATCCPKLVPMGEAPFCPFGWIRAGCLVDGEVDINCCPEERGGGGEASCMVGNNNRTVGKVCSPNGARTTCCPPPEPPSQFDKHMFCFIVSMHVGGEADLTKSHYYRRRSIFACQEWSVYTDGPIPTLETINIGAFRSQWVSEWGSWANTRVFVRAWAAVFAENKWSRAGWTVKADADAVWFPERLAWHLKSQPIWPPKYLRPPGRWFVGPLEAMSFYAVERMVSRRSEHCNFWLDNSPEDGWVAKCLDAVGAQAIWDGAFLRRTSVVSACHDGWVVNFHPFKSVGAWNACESMARSA